MKYVRRGEAYIYSNRVVGLKPARVDLILDIDDEKVKILISSEGNTAVYTWPVTVATAYKTNVWRLLK